MTRPRVFHPGPEDSVRIERGTEAFHYLVRVARVRPGEEVALFCGDGADYVYRLREAGPGGLELELAAKITVDTDPPLSLTLIAAVLKGDRTGEVIRSAIPLGVDCVIPFVAARGVRRPRSGILQRWEKIAADAVRQCGRTRTAQVHPVCDSFGEALEVLTGRKGGVPGLVFWEDTDRDFESALAEAGAGEAGPAGFCLAIGPEGGFEEDEVQAAREWGLVPCRMGPRILRAELAAVVAATLIQHRLGDL